MKETRYNTQVRTIQNFWKVIIKTTNIPKAYDAPIDLVSSSCSPTEEINVIDNYFAKMGKI